MWRVYKYTRKDKEYEVYKEALNEATNKQQMKFESISTKYKSHSKSLHAYVRSKQNVRDTFEPLKDNAGDIITQ